MARETPLVGESKRRNGGRCGWRDWALEPRWTRYSFVDAIERLVLTRQCGMTLAEPRIKAIVYRGCAIATNGSASYLKRYGFAVFYLDGGSSVRPCIRKLN